MKIGIQRAERSHGWSEDHGGHCLEGSAEDEASVVDDGGALEEDVDVDDGGVDADLCDSSCVRLCITFGVSKNGSNRRRAKRTSWRAVSCTARWTPDGSFYGAKKSANTVYVN